MVPGASHSQGAEVLLAPTCDQGQPRGPSSRDTRLQVQVAYTDSRDSQSQEKVQSMRLSRLDLKGKHFSQRIIIVTEALNPSVFLTE